MFLSLLLVLILGCGREKPKTKLVYFGFDDRSETPADVMRLVTTWGEKPPCEHWRVTIKPQEADYQILFGTAYVTVVDRRGEVLYHGGIGAIELAHGNPDGSGVNICKLTGE